MVAEVAEVSSQDSSDIVDHGLPGLALDMPVECTLQMKSVDQELGVDAWEVVAYSDSSSAQGGRTCCPCCSAGRHWTTEMTCLVRW